MFYSSENNEEKFQVSPENAVAGGLFSPELQAETEMACWDLWHVEGWWAFCAEDGVINCGGADYFEDRGFNQETAFNIMVAHLKWGAVQGNAPYVE